MKFWPTRHRTTACKSANTKIDRGLLPSGSRVQHSQASCLGVARTEEALIGTEVDCDAVLPTSRHRESADRHSAPVLLGAPLSVGSFPRDQNFKAGAETISRGRRTSPCPAQGFSRIPASRRAPSLTNRLPTEHSAVAVGRKPSPHY